MLTADLVSARRRAGELLLVKLDAAGRARALELSERLVVVTTAHLGATREELAAALGAIEVGAREHKLRDGLAKLLEDRSVFDPGDADAAAIRREVFTRSSHARRALEPGQKLDRQGVLADVAALRARSPESIEQALFADLRGSHRLLAFDKISPESLVASYERAQAQAVLLRAVQVVVHVRCGTAASLRALFRRLRFLQLLFVITRTETGQRIVIDGPFSLFESVTKYGLQLALVLPALEGCGAWQITADVRWGKERTPLLFRASGDALPSRPGRGHGLPNEVQALMASFEALGTGWRVSPSTDILDLAGVGLTVPDLVFERGDGSARERIYLEVMGYWSREAVWKRIELVEAGLAERIVFAVSAHLRVSEEALDAEGRAALYVYKRTMSARAVAERVDGLSRSHVRLEKGGQGER